MTDFPVKPKGLDENTWYRQIEKEIALTVISADPHEGKCPECRERRLIFHCQVYPARNIVSCCKDCALARAGDPAKVWVRADEYLRRKWVANAKDPAKSRAMKQRRSLTQTGVPRGLGSAKDF